MAVTLTQAQQMLQRYLTAEQEVLEGRTVSFGGRTLSMVDLDEIRAGRQEWERKVNGLQQAATGQSRPYKLADFG
jgi:hypothetical protein